MGDGDRSRVLFLCTGNSCRSQMAEGWARHLLGDRVDACSAGTSPQGVNPLAVRAMRECGIDLGLNRSKRVDACSPATLDLVVTVCDDAREHCPVFLSRNARTRLVHHSFDDPPRLTAEACDDEDAMPCYRRVRDEIRRFVEERLPGLFGSELLGRTDAR